MNTDMEQVSCDEHGKAYEAWVCRHLFENPAQVWYSGEPTSDNPWPDAWCEKCDAEFMRAGEWNDSNMACTEIKLICHFCYERRRAQAVTDESNSP
jgi:hypothetical protein